MLSPVIVQSRRIHENILLNKDSGTTNSTINQYISKGTFKRRT